MRPANLIPVEERRASGHGVGSAPVAYAIVAALLIAVGAVTLLVVTDNQISTHKDELAQARRQVAAAEARATKLAAYTEFHSTALQRSETISNLAESRFDWEKVMRQLALVLPRGVRLTDLSGAARGGASAGAEGSALGAGIAGPSLAINGCAAGQEGVAGFVTALKDIDGVTRVGVQTSNQSTESGGESEVASAGCRSSEAQFQMVVAFDAAPIPAAVAGEAAPEEVTVAPEEAAEPSSEEVE